MKRFISGLDSDSETESTFVNMFRSDKERQRHQSRGRRSSNYSDAGMNSRERHTEPLIHSMKSFE